MSHINIKLTVGILFFFLLFSPSIIMGYDGKNSDKSLDQVMMSFINAMVRKDKNTVLSFFSERIPCKWVYYEIATTKPLYVNYFYYKNLANDFKNEKGHYNHFFDEPNHYTYLSNFDRNVMWKKKGKNTFVHPESDFGTTYIKWHRVNGRWVISEMGDSGP